MKEVSPNSTTPKKQCTQLDLENVKGATFAQTSASLKTFNSKFIHTADEKVSIYRTLPLQAKCDTRLSFNHNKAGLNYSEFSFCNAIVLKLTFIPPPFSTDPGTTQSRVIPSF